MRAPERAPGTPFRLGITDGTAVASAQVHNASPGSLPVVRLGWTMSRSTGRDSCFLAEEQSWRTGSPWQLAAESDDYRQRRERRDRAARRCRVEADAIATSRDLSRQRNTARAMCKENIGLVLDRSPEEEPESLLNQLKES
jgi:hypothetical protein